MNDPFTFTYRKVIVEAERFRLPSIYGYREFVGGMISYGPTISDTYRQAAGYVDKILDFSDDPA